MPASSAASSARSRPTRSRRPSPPSAGGANSDAWPAVLMLALLNLAGGADGLIGLGEADQGIGVGDVVAVGRGALDGQAAALAHGQHERLRCRNPWPRRA